MALQTHSTPRCPYCTLHHPHQQFKSRAQACQAAQKTKIAELQYILDFESKEIEHLIVNYSRLQEAYEKEKNSNDLEQLQIEARDLKRSIKRMDKKHEKIKDTAGQWDDI